MDQPMIAPLALVVTKKSYPIKFANDDDIVMPPSPSVKLKLIGVTAMF